MTLTEKTKRYLAVGGGALACAALVAAISLQFQKASVGEDTVPESSQQMTDVIVDPSNLYDGRDEEAQAEETESAETGDTEMEIKPNISAGDSEQAVDAGPAQTDQSEQSIQPEAVKPEEPSPEELKNPTKKPDGTEVETPPVSVDHDTYVPEEEEPGNSGGGLPGFDSVPNGGSNQVIQADDMYENGNKIGIMD